MRGGGGLGGLDPHRPDRSVRAPHPARAAGRVMQSAYPMPHRAPLWVNAGIQVGRSHISASAIGREDWGPPAISPDATRGPAPVRRTADPLSQLIRFGASRRESTSRLCRAWDAGAGAGTSAKRARTSVTSACQAGISGSSSSEPPGGFRAAEPEPWAGLIGLEHRPKEMSAGPDHYLCPASLFS